MHRNWSVEECEFLCENWGTMSTGRIANQLGRSQIAVVNKARILRLGPHLTAGNGVSLCELIYVMYGYTDRSSYSYKLQTWLAAGIPVYRQQVRKCSFCMVRIDKFWKWAERHRELINLARMEEGVLGVEPDWAKEKRRIDFMNPVQWKTRWTPEEDDMLRALLAGYRLSYFELAQRFNRSESAIKRRIYDLGLKSWPVRAKPTPWMQEDVDTLVRMYHGGYAMKLISQQLGRSEQSCRGRLERLQKEGYV